MKSVRNKIFIPDLGWRGSSVYNKNCIYDNDAVTRILTISKKKYITLSMNDFESMYIKIYYSFDEIWHIRHTLISTKCLKK